MGEDDFRASLYHHLRKYTDKNKIITMLMGASVGGHKPDISIFKGEDCLVTIELKAISKEKGEIKSYDPSSIRDCMETLKLCAPHSERGYFIHIDKNDQGYNDGFAEWKDDYYRNLWHEVEGDMTYIFEVKKGRTNKRRV